MKIIKYDCSLNNIQGYSTGKSDEVFKGLEKSVNT